MARTSAQNKQRTRDCAEYRASVGTDCEVSRWLTDDRDAVRWMSGVKLGGTATHHICGRGNDPRFEHFCNLIQVSTAAHLWGHENPVEFQIIVLWAKLQKHLNRELMNLVPDDESRKEWHVPTMDLLVRPFDGLAARVDFLMNKLGDGRYFDIGLLLLDHIERVEGKNR
jgi:hypothetical protein